MSTRQRAYGAAVLMVLAAVATGAPADKPAKLRVLLLSGANNHNWKATTPALVKILKTSGRFAVTVTDEPQKLTAEAFAKYDVIVSNWTPWPNVKKRIWDAKTEKAFLDSIRGGKGLVVVHAASTAFQSWPEFQQLAGATWGLGKTGHGAYHEFGVTIADANHPVTAGMKDFRIADELWHRMAAHRDRKVLCTAHAAKAKGGSGQAEPVAITTRLGKGRGFNLVLGHDARAMQNAGFQTLMVRGTEWAATGKVTLPVVKPSPKPTAKGVRGPTGEKAEKPDPDALLKATADYKFGQTRKPLLAVEKFVASAAVEPARRKALAAKLAAMLSSKATLDAKKFLCGQLSLIGAPAEIPALAGLLGDKDLSLAARSALERMPGEASLSALRAALGTTTGSRRVGLICSLGERRDAKAVGALAAALGEKDAVVAGAAIDALGKIGGAAAAKALSAAGKELPAKLLRSLADALLRCAEGLLAAGEADQAAAIFQDLSAEGQPKHIRAAAFPGLIASQKDKAADILLGALTGKDPAMQAAAVRAVRIAGDPKLMKTLAAALPQVVPPVRATIIETLGERGIASALPAVTKQASSEDPVVRRAALSALGRLGDAATVPMLVKLAADAKGADQAVARRSLMRLRADGIDEALKGQLASSSSSPAARRESVVALRQRRAVSAVPALLAAAADEDRQVRTEALKAVGALADAKACPALIGLLAKAKTDAGRFGIEAALIAVCRRAGEADEATAPVLAGLAGAGADLTGSLLRVAANLGGDKAMKAIRSALKDPKAPVRTAAIRALGDWPDAAPLEDLLAVAKSADGPVAKILALRGFVKLSAKATDREPAAMAKLYARAMALARRTEEKKALLSGLSGVRCPEALAAAEALMAEPALVNEAALAVVKVADKLWVSQPALVKAAMKRLLSAKVGESVRAEATRVLVELSKPINLARDAKATSPDGLEKDGQAGGDQAAIDGNPNTYWDEANGQKLYRLVITFPEPRKVAVVRILAFEDNSFAPEDFQILCDGKVVKSVRKATYRNRLLSLAFPATLCKSVELKITGYSGGSPAIREVEIYGLSLDEKDK